MWLSAPMRAGLALAFAVLSAAPAAAVSATGPKVTAKAAIIVDAESGEIIWSRNPDLRLHPASTTKVMTAIVAVESEELSRRVRTATDGLGNTSEFGGAGAALPTVTDAPPATEGPSPTPTQPGPGTKIHLPILIQRGIARGVVAAGFSKRSDKPWEGYDYFHKNSEGHIDLKEVIGGWGKATPSLHEFAAACGIPGKIDTSGENVIDLWLDGDVRSIVNYNEFDALTTYLLWLRTARFAGLIPAERHEEEVRLVRELIDRRIEKGGDHLERYLAKWDRLGDGAR